jgi:Ca-activated chloride channel family protein
MTNSFKSDFRSLPKRWATIKIRNVLHQNCFKVLKSPRIILCIIALLTFINLQAQASPKQLTRILIILDCSNSMNSLFESESKFNIAKRLVSKMVDSLDKQANLQMALRCYGHQKSYPPQECDDSKLEVPFSASNAWLIRSKLDKVSARGTTPIALSLEQCAADFPDRNSKNVVLLITDGKEECGGDPCALSAALQSKGISLKPFIVGVGKLDVEVIDAFKCVGNYYDASTEQSFSQVLNIIITQVLNATTAQINLLDINGKPTETDVAMTLYDQKTGMPKYHWVHTFNNRGLPDTLRPDAALDYHLVVHTLPPVEKKNIKLEPGKHNTIAVDAPQGLLKVQAGETNATRDIKCILRKAGETNTLEAMDIREQRKLIVGAYDMEILTLPRTYVKNVQIGQSQTTTVKIDEPGIVNFMLPTIGIASIFKEDKSKVEWVCTLTEGLNQETIRLQPGKYKLVFRAKSVKETLMTSVLDFTVTPGASQKVQLR